MIDALEITALLIIILSVIALFAMMGELSAEVKARGTGSRDDDSLERIEIVGGSSSQRVWPPGIDTLQHRPRAIWLS